MKLDALDHPKTMDLSSRLDAPLPTVLGHLELLWAFTGKKAPQGNIGKWPNGAIARACYWQGPADVFVSALVDAGFVKTDAEHRLVVHDWHDHAPGWVRAKLAKLKQDFLSCGTSERSSVASSEPTSDGSSEPSSKPSIQEKRSTREVKPSALVFHDSLPRPEWEEWIAHRKARRWPCDDTTLRKQLAILAKLDAATQRQVIDTSIQAGWRGLFAPKGVERKVRAPNPLDPTAHIEMR